jgi:spore germination cell wall hydrolase CwlJ-like protein
MILLFLSWFTADQNQEVKTTNLSRVEPVQHPEIVGDQLPYNPVKINYVSDDLNRDALCIAKMVYNEARGPLFSITADEENKNVFSLTDIDGFRAHFSVVLERVDSGMFPQDVCSVILQDGQFSSSLKDKKQKYNDDMLIALRDEALNHLLYGYRLDNTDSALFFDSNKKTKKKVDYNRSFYKIKTTEIAGHSFYKLEPKN